MKKLFFPLRFSILMPKYSCIWANIPYGNQCDRDMLHLLNILRMREIQVSLALEKGVLQRFILPKNACFFLLLYMAQ